MVQSINRYCQFPNDKMSQLLSDWLYQYSFVEPELKLGWNISIREKYINNRKRSMAGVHVTDVYDNDPQSGLFDNASLDSL